MEAGFFRALAVELAITLVGRRIEKIYAPGHGSWTFDLQSQDAPCNLLFWPVKPAGHLFTSSTRPANPAQPPAEAMWYRKRVQGRRILCVHSNWPNLSIALQLTPSNRFPGLDYMVMDLRNGLSLVAELPEGYGDAPEWPALEDVIDDPEIWREYPHISPPLRRVLAALDEEDAQELYMNVVLGEATQFHIPKAKDGLKPPLVWRTNADDTAFETAIEAATLYGEQMLFPLLEMEDTREDKKRIKAERKRIQRNLARLEQEEARLQGFIDDKIRAEALQAEMYRLKDGPVPESLTLSHPTEGEVVVALNPHLSAVENMQRYFVLAAKGDRGMVHIERRRELLQAELLELETGKSVPEKVDRSEPVNTMAPTLPKRYRGLDVNVFRTSDGFICVRGKNKRANHDVISKAASAFDFWFHVADGPSSHVILRRDHPGQEIPESTLREAAQLCALRSYRKDDKRADVMYALVKDVRKVKGYAHGQVAVDTVEGVIRIEMDKTVEERLKIKVN